MNSGESGYVLLEVLVSLTIFSGLVLATGGIAQNVLNQVHRQRPHRQIEKAIHVLAHPRSASSDRALTRSSRRSFDNGDRWMVYDYPTRDGNDVVRMPVLIPASSGEASPESTTTASSP